MTLEGQVPPQLVAVRCPGERRGAIGQPPCGRILKESPAGWGMAIVTVLVDQTHATGRGEVVRCPQCRAWLEVTYDQMNA